MKEDRVLALSLRPKSLEELIGQEDIIKTIDIQFKSHRIPHFYIISGPVGCGKTTLARILSQKIHQLYNENQKNQGNQRSNTNEENNTKEGKERFETKEINGANQTGIDEIRKLIEHMSFRPLPPSKVKIIILDEAHQLSIPAQNALITETEDVPEHVFYIFCTSSPQKIIPALQRRAFHIHPKSLKNKKDISKLVTKCAKYAHYEASVDEFVESIIAFEKFSPGLIIQAAEKYFCGLSLSDSILNSGGDNGMIGNIDVLSVCRSVIGGKWQVCADLMKNATRSDAFCIRSSILGYLKTCLIKCSGYKAINFSKAIRYIVDVEIHDETAIIPSLLSALCLACAQMQIND